VRDRPLGVLGWRPAAVHQALLVRQLSDDVVFFDQGELDPDGRAELAAHDVPIVDGKVGGLVVEDDQLVGVRLVDGTVVAPGALRAAPVRAQRRPAHRPRLRAGRRRPGLRLPPR
jgi:thioredoxin reductase (NADPH)